VSGERAPWRCQPDDGTVRVEASVTSGQLVLCFWRCEATAPAVEATLRELGVAIACETRGPCRHAGDRAGGGL
jgi:hypothetical protein